MSFDNAYEALVEGADDSRWAFGTGFTDPLDGVDTSVPPGVDGADLAVYCLMLGDDALVLSHRLQEWVTLSPELEDEVALANIGLDLLGQARLLLARASKADGSNRTEDDLAFFRAEHEFRNVRLVEHPAEDFAELIVQLLVFATWRLDVMRRLGSSRDPVLAAIAAKTTSEIAYHRDYAARWAVRLGDGTHLSRSRLLAAFAQVLPYADELFCPHEVEQRVSAADIGVDPAGARPEFDRVLTEVQRAAAFEIPDVPARAGVAGRTGRSGVHTEAMGYLLAELQSLARAHPEATW